MPSWIPQVFLVFLSSLLKGISVMHMSKSGPLLDYLSFYKYRNALIINVSSWVKLQIYYIPRGYQESTHLFQYKCPPESPGFSHFSFFLLLKGISWLHLNKSCLLIDSMLIKKHRNALITHIFPLVEFQTYHIPRGYVECTHRIL